MTDLLTKWRALPLMWTEALRALVCLLPMIVATALDRTTYLATLGQGAFFFSALFLPRRLAGRFVMGSLIIALGLGFYLIGGAVAPYPWVAVIFTFFVCLNLSFMTSWKRGGPLAFDPGDDLHRRAQHRLTGKGVRQLPGVRRRPGLVRAHLAAPILETDPTAAGERGPERRGTGRAGPSDGHRYLASPGGLLPRRIHQDRLGAQPILAM